MSSQIGMSIVLGVNVQLVVNCQVEEVMYSQPMVSGCAISTVVFEEEKIRKCLRKG